MKRKSVSVAIALLLAVVFTIYAIQPGIFNMIGYSISILIFPENSPENLKYGKAIIYSFDILCGVLVFFIAYGVLKRLKKE